MSSGKDDAIAAAFLRAHQGYGTDMVICDDRLRAAFLAEAANACPGTRESEVLWILLNCRKSSTLGPVAKVSESHDHAAYEESSRRAAVSIKNSSGESIDRALCDPELRSQFDELARRIHATRSSTIVAPRDLRLAALALRKQKRL